MKEILFCGCSYVHGIGFPLEKNDPNLWVNHIHQSDLFRGYTLTNKGQGGRSNSGIFQDAVHQLTHKQYDFAFISWTSMPRYEMHLGLELYETRASFIPNGRFHDHYLNGITYTRSYLESVNKRFTSLAHPHYEILNLVHYVNCLVKIGEMTGTRVFFINALCPWDSGYFDYIENASVEKITPFTKKITNIDTRDDSGILDLYEKIHREYSAAGGIQKHFWLNLNHSLRSSLIDTNNDGVHPGIESNKNYSDTLIKAIKSKI